MDERFATRFWSKVVRTDACWEFKGMLRKGYGQFVIAGVRPKLRVQAHRFSWSIANGPIPKGLCVLHRCDNRSCVRPDHLFLGTNDDNVQDRVNKGRSAHGETQGSAKLTNEAVIEIRQRHSLGESCGALAKKHGMHAGNIRALLLRKTWKHV